MRREHSLGLYSPLALALSRGLIGAPVIALRCVLFGLSYWMAGLRYTAPCYLRYLASCWLMNFSARAQAVVLPVSSYCRWWSRFASAAVCCAVGGVVSRRVLPPLWLADGSRQHPEPLTQWDLNSLPCTPPSCRVPGHHHRSHHAQPHRSSSRQRRRHSAASELPLAASRPRCAHCACCACCGLLKDALHPAPSITPMVSATPLKIRAHCPPTSPPHTLPPGHHQRLHVATCPCLPPMGLPGQLPWLRCGHVVLLNC